MSRRNYDRLSGASHEDADADEEQGAAHRVLGDADLRRHHLSTSSNSSAITIELASTNSRHPHRHRSAGDATTSGSSSSHRRGDGPRPSYSRVAGEDDAIDDAGVDDDGCVDVPLSGASDASREACDEGSSTSFVVKILDFAQQTFEVRVEPLWTVGRLKEAGVPVHRVPVALQRLVYSGKLLQDDSTISGSGIKPGSIVHLFPKPRVVIQGGDGNSVVSADSSASSTSPASGANDPSNNSGARVPTIVLDANEAQQRSQILVLGSAEYMEAQNNVKLFSFMLLVISAIELLSLLSMAMGVPQDGGPGTGVPGSSLYPSDDIPTYDDAGYDYWQNHSGGNGTDATNPHGASNLVLYPNRSGWPNTVDWVISAAGVYVALMGIQATNENTRRLARVYLFGTVGVGICWLLYNYYITVQIDEAIVAQQPHPGPTDAMTDDDIYKAALSVMVLPAMVWVLCCLRAAQFHQLLSDAENEAEDRIRAQMEESSSLTRSVSGRTADAPSDPQREPSSDPARPTPANADRSPAVVTLV